MLLGLLALYAFVIACPDLAVGTSLKRIASADADRDAHFVAWHTDTPSVAALMRSPRPRQTAVPQTAHATAADPVELSRPSDPLTRLDQTHLAQYGGDLEALTGPDPEPEAPAGQ